MVDQRRAGSELAELLDVINGFQATMVIVAAVRLGLFEKIAGGSRDAAQLADLAGANPAMLKRLLVALEALSLAVHDDHGKLQLTERGALLVTGEVGRALSAWVTLVEHQYLPAWSQMGQSVAAGVVAFEHAFGMRAWEHRVLHPELNDAFQRIMADERVRMIPESADAVAAAYPFDEARVVDVGGGTGKLLRAILRRHPRARGVLFEQEHVVDHERHDLAEVYDRCEISTGSFFDHVPSGGDVYVLKHVLHNWDDASCARILTNCVRSMSPEARILVVESLLPESGLAAARPIVMLDLHMMCMHTGRERTLSGYRDLFTAAGCQVERVLPRTPDCPDIIVART